MSAMPAARPAWVWTAPFGRPVVPLVNTMSAAAAGLDPGKRVEARAAWSSGPPRPRPPQARRSSVGEARPRCGVAGRSARAASAPAVATAWCSSGTGMVGVERHGEAAGQPAPEQGPDDVTPRAAEDGDPPAVERRSAGQEAGGDPDGVVVEGGVGVLALGVDDGDPVAVLWDPTDEDVVVVRGHCSVLWSVELEHDRRSGGPGPAISFVRGSRCRAAGATAGTRGWRRASPARAPDRWSWRRWPGRTGRCALLGGDPDVGRCPAS